MSDEFSDEQWTSILQLARAALELPEAAREEFIRAGATDPQIAREACKLAEELEQPEQDEPGRPGSLTSGSQLGRFVLLDYLGSGGTGAVYSARDPELRRTVAIKLLKPDAELLQDPNELVREARTASALNHPNIVTVHEIVHTEGSVAIVMELVPGEALRKRLAGGMTEHEVSGIGRQIAEGLAAAHAAGVVHRDIKPENVMVLPDGRIKILDFGLARYSPIPGGAATQTGMPAGTPRYMSPEHVAGGKVTAASDVFAFGVVLYEMAAGRHPFAGGSALELLHAIATEEAAPVITLNSAISERLSLLITSMLRKDPAARPTAAQTAAELRSTGPLPLEAPKGASGTNFWRRKRTLAGVMLVLAAGAAAGWKFSRPPAAYRVMEQLTTLVPENRTTAAAISSDGKLLAYANVDGVFVRTVGIDESTRLHGPPNFTVDHLAWLADDSGLLASGFSEGTGETSIWSAPLAGGASRQLRTAGRLGVASPDGSRTAFIQNDFSSVWTMASDGGDQRRLIRGQSDEAFDAVAWSGDGRHLIVLRRSAPAGTLAVGGPYRYTLESVSADTGAAADRLENFFVRSPVARTTGELLFLGGPKPGVNGRHQVWSTTVDPATGRFSRRYRKLETKVDRLSESFDLSVTRDGSKIALIGRGSRESVFVADFNRPALRLENVTELTLDGKASYPHAWAADSKSVIFESSRSGGYDLFLQSLGERVAKPLVTTPRRWEVLPQLTPDGRSVLYAAGPAEGGSSHYRLMRVPVAGGPTAEVPGGAELEEFRCSIGAKGRCVVRKSVGHASFVYSEIDPARGVGRELARTPWLASLLLDWDISPDGKLIAIPYHDLRAGRIRIVSLDSTSGLPAARELELPELANLTGVAWAADQSGWFVSVDSSTSAGHRMYFCGLDGHLTPLGGIQGWAVPSPNGRKVAYLDRLYEANVWMLRRD